MTKPILSSSSAARAAEPHPAEARPEHLESSPLHEDDFEMIESAPHDALSRPPAPGEKYLTIGSDNQLAWTANKNARATVEDVQQRLRASLEDEKATMPQLLRAQQILKAMQGKESDRPARKGVWGTLFADPQKGAELQQVVAQRIKQREQDFNAYALHRLQRELGDNIEPLSADTARALERAQTTFPKLPGILLEFLESPSLEEKRAAYTASQNHIFDNPYAVEEFGHADLGKLNDLLARLWEAKGELRNLQFHTDSLPTLVPGDLDDNHKVRRFYLNEQAFDKKSRDLSRLTTQVAQANAFARSNGFAEAPKWVERLSVDGISGHSGWQDASIPSDKEPAPLKGVRTLGLLNGDRARFAKVPLDLSPLGPLSQAQAKEAMRVLQLACEDIAGGKSVMAFDRVNPELFNKAQQEVLKRVSLQFAADSENAITKMHQELIDRNPKSPKYRVVS